MAWIILIASGVLEAVWRGVVEAEDLARLLSLQFGVELRHEHPGADFVQVVGGGEAFDGFVVHEALDVDLRVVAVDQRCLGGFDVGI